MEQRVGLENFEWNRIVEPLLSWYGKNARKLPWREGKNPYQIWVSEIMLQQTRVEAVIPYYKRFLEQLPDIRALAECPEEKLLKLWEGLGYYNRVRNMQAAAQTIMVEYGGIFPKEYETIKTLKGIGSYTAGAISSIAFSVPKPAVDGNVLRVTTRVSGDEQDILLASTRKKVENVLETVLPRENPGTMNQALMELGATICIPNGAPKCGECPWKAFCVTAQTGDYERIPVREKKTKRRMENRTILVAKWGDKVLLDRRPKKGLLAGMYEFPNLTGHLDRDQVVEEMKRRGLSPLRLKRLEDAVHIFSHVEWHMRGYFVQLDETGECPENQMFVDVRETEKKYPIPSAFRRFCAYLDLKLGNEAFGSEDGEK